MKKLIMISAFMASMVSCTDLNVIPDSQLTDESAYKEKTEFLNGLSGVDATLGIWSEIVYKIGISADDMIAPARGADWKGDAQAVHLHTWTRVKRNIYRHLKNYRRIQFLYRHNRQE